MGGLSMIRCAARAWPHSWGSAIVLASLGFPAQFQEVFFGWKRLRMKECWREKALEIRQSQPLTGEGDFRNSEGSTSPAQIPFLCLNAALPASPSSLRLWLGYNAQPSFPSPSECWKQRPGHTYLCFFLSCFKNSSVEMWLTYMKLHLFTVYNVISFDICLQSWNHHHNQENEHVCHCQKFPPATL